ncbi:MAG TPA: hypothetical protein PLW79_03975, partial [Caldisericia bacterium]|nr:hypothetical protein [Caldisericia bacterium]HRT36940.1 hypothetical protein [Caldisericia bacterium]
SKIKNETKVPDTKVSFFKNLSFINFVIIRFEVKIIVFLLEIIKKYATIIEVYKFIFIYLEFINH